jgi:hypothetical protein
MKQAFLTFIRTKNDEFSFLAIDNPNNLIKLQEYKLRSGQPMIIIKENESLCALYAISNDAELFQIYGKQDYLFLMKSINDISLINIKKYNYIRHILLEAFEILSIQESKLYKNIFESLEELIFYTTLHTELSNQSIKNIIIREVKKLDIPSSIKNRMLDKIKLCKQISESYLRKKIDVDLTGYGIYINTLK